MIKVDQVKNKVAPFCIYSRSFGKKVGYWAHNSVASDALNLPRCVYLILICRACVDVNMLSWCRVEWAVFMAQYTCTLCSLFCWRSTLIAVVRVRVVRCYGWMPFTFSAAVANCNASYHIRSTSYNDNSLHRTVYLPAALAKDRNVFDCIAVCLNIYHGDDHRTQYRTFINFGWKSELRSVKFHSTSMVILPFWGFYTLQNRFCPNLVGRGKMIEIKTSTINRETFMKWRRERAWVEMSYLEI